MAEIHRDHDGGENQHGALALEHPEQRERKRDREQRAHDVHRPPADAVGQPAEQRQADEFQKRRVQDSVEHQRLGQPELGGCVDDDEHGEHIDP